MSTYAFILGKDPELSLAELSAVYPDALFTQKTPEFVVAEISKKLVQADLDQLGGILKIAKIEQEGEGKIEENMDLILESLLEGHESGKLNYGLSLYGLSDRVLRTLLIGLKKLLKSAQISSRFANQDFKNLSIAQHKGLKGPELIICKSGQLFFVGKVIAVQDIDAYSKRDYDKPFRDMKVGMLPPKLAQILLNLTGSAKTVWDPFCGGGVLVMEGLLQGREMLGSDINAKTLVGAQKNVDWVKSQFNLKAHAELFEHDATTPLLNKKCEAIAFEGYLGPPQTKLKSERELRPIMSELDELYLHFFRQLKAAKFKGPIVAALPFFRTQQGRELSLNCVREIESLGFQIDSLLPHRICLSLKYARRDQLVGREVRRFKTQ